MRKLILLINTKRCGGLAFALLSWLSVAGLGVVPGVAAIRENEGRYQICLNMIDTSPEVALKQAKTWYEGDGGVAALHCEALALLGLGKNSQAAEKLESLARDPGAGGITERAAILDQAGNAWILAGRFDKASASLSSAIALDPVNKEYLIDRASAHHLSGDWSSALSDLTSAIELDSRDVEALILRAAAYREMGDLSHAKDDIARALVLEPDNATALREQKFQRDQAAGRKINSD